MYEIGANRRTSTGLAAGLTLEVNANSGGTVWVYNRGESVSDEELTNRVVVPAGESVQFGPFADHTNFIFINNSDAAATYEHKKLERVAAANVRVADSAENFTGRSVEDALAEIATRLDALEA